MFSIKSIRNQSINIMKVNMSTDDSLNIIQKAHGN